MIQENHVFFFFKQKTAYEIKECDWSSDVCSSDLKPKIVDETLVQMPFDQTTKILNSSNLNLLGELAVDREDLEKKADKFKDMKVAMKIISSDVVHKSDQGAVRVNVEGVEDILAVWDEMTESLYESMSSIEIEGILIQPMIEGKEVIVGMKRDEVFGPMVVFGMGGVFVEVFKDVAMRVAPFDREEAFDMIQETKGYALLQGMRGEKSADISGLLDVITSISKMSLEHPEIKELDLNPVIVNEEGAHVVDARFMK